jgi:hypothetical protein
LPATASSGNGIHASECDSFAIVLLREGQPPQQMARPWAALCVLPSGGGLLFAQAGSTKLLYCQHPAELELGQAGEVLLFGSHPGAP